MGMIIITVFAAGAIRDGGQQPLGSRNAPAETSSSGVIRKEFLCALLALAPGDIKVGIEEQRVTRSRCIGYDAERLFAVLPARSLLAQVLLPDRSSLRAGAVRICDERKVEVQGPSEALKRYVLLLAVTGDGLR